MTAGLKATVFSAAALAVFPAARVLGTSPKHGPRPLILDLGRGDEDSRACAIPGGYVVGSSMYNAQSFTVAWFGLTGALLRTATLPLACGDEGTTVDAVLPVAGGGVDVVTMDCTLRIDRFDAATKPVWSRSITLPGFASPDSRTIVPWTAGTFLLAASGERTLKGDCLRDDAYVFAMDAAGRVRWSRSFSAEPLLQLFHAGQFVTALLPLPEGGIMVGGYQQFWGDYHARGWPTLRRLDASGAVVWSVTLTGPDDLLESVRAIVRAPSGVTYCLSSSQHRGGPEETVLHAFTEDGRHLWRRQVRSLMGDPVALRVMALVGDRLICAGCSRQRKSEFGSIYLYSSHDWTVMEISPEGREVWRHDRGDGGRCAALSIVATGRDSFDVFGYMGKREIVERFDLSRP